jgi:hypothetical protein
MFIETQKMNSLFHEVYELYSEQRKQSRTDETAKPGTYESGIQKGRKECWEAIHKLMEANRTV